MSHGGDRNGRRWRPGRLVLLVLLIGAVAVALVARALTSGPDPQLSSLTDQPVLESPVPATELGRLTRESRWGLGLGPDVTSRVVVAYQVDLDADAALEAWDDAYGGQYGLEPGSDALVQSLTGTIDGIRVTVEVGDGIEDYAARDAFPAPVEGAGAVVTVQVAGKD